jgi:hypothetical protein
MRSKEQTKTLMLHIMGITVDLSLNKCCKLSFMCRILKKEASELKSLCTELGLKIEACKSFDKETGKEVDDFLIKAN